METMHIQNDPKAIRKMMMAFLVPVMLASVLQSIGQIVAMFLVGQKIGVEAIAAISAFFPFFFFLMSFAIGVGSGSSILVGQTYGAKNYDKMKQVIGVTLAFTTILSVVTAIFGGFFIEKILFFMDTPDNIFEASVS
ncbi:MAG TPA: MATE family efflux transporter, partial [Savagea sp.]